VDEILSSLPGGSVTAAALVAVLLGLRHATDPDHLTAVATLILSENDRSRNRAGALGLAWGAGHAATLLAFGLPIVLATPLLPEWAHGLAEVMVGIVIALLSARLILRWRRGYFHAHVHDHGDVRHAHPHVHEREPAGGGHATRHEHAHAGGRPRSLRGSFAMGLLQGVGGSAGAGLIVIAASSDAAARGIALAVFAAGTAISMWVVSAALGRAVARGPARRLEALVPVIGVAGFAFGVVYGLHAAPLP
jgi:cytochrome c biogenesis protein CcdA